MIVGSGMAAARSIQVRVLSDAELMALGAPVDGSSVRRDQANTPAAPASRPHAKNNATRSDSLVTAQAGTSAKTAAAKSNRKAVRLPVQPAGVCPISVITRCGVQLRRTARAAGFLLAVRPERLPFRSRS